MSKEEVCELCDGTGVIETGNNDLVCNCPAGDTAEFNVATAEGLQRLTGAEMKRRDIVEMLELLTTDEDRLKVLELFCHSCGTRQGDRPCQCWNDE